MNLSLMKHHSSECQKVGKEHPQFKPIAPTSQSPRCDVPNRSTFQCPYCGLANLACDSFVQHCLTMHKDNTAKVVSKQFLLGNIYKMIWFRIIILHVLFA